MDVQAVLAEDLVCIQRFHNNSNTVEKYELVGSVSLRSLQAAPGAGKRVGVVLRDKNALLHSVTNALTKEAKSDLGEESSHEAQVVLSPGLTGVWSYTTKPPAVGNNKTCVRLVKYRCSVAHKPAAVAAADEGAAGEGVKPLKTVSKVAIQVQLSPLLSVHGLESLVLQVSLAPLYAPCVGEGGVTLTPAVEQVQMLPNTDCTYIKAQRVLAWTYKPPAAGAMPPSLEFQAMIQLSNVATGAPTTVLRPVFLPGIIKCMLHKSLLTELDVRLDPSPSSVEYRCKAEYRFL